VSDLVSQLREEYRLKVFENRVLKRTFGSMRDEVMEVWSVLPSSELPDTVLEDEKCGRNLVVKPEGRSQPEK
jgi:hypothetical protein